MWPFRKNNPIFFVVLTMDILTPEGKSIRRTYKGTIENAKTQEDVFDVARRETLKGLPADNTVVIFYAVTSNTI